MKRANPQLPAAPIQKRLDATRRSLSLTWDEFADYLGVSKRTLLRTMASSKLGITVADRIFYPPWAPSGSRLATGVE